MKFELRLEENIWFKWNLKLESLIESAAIGNKKLIVPEENRREMKLEYT